jgi:hypothetical protein
MNAKCLGICPENDLAICQIDMEEFRKSIEYLAMRHSDPSSDPFLQRYGTWSFDNVKWTLQHVSTPFVSIGYPEDDHGNPTGMQALAVGYPLGEGYIKVSEGLISGFSNGKIQTQAPINPGMSGAPMFLWNPTDKKCIFIGICSAGLVGEDVSNVGFVISVDRLFQSMRDMITHCWSNGIESKDDIYVSRVPWIGALLGPIGDYDLTHPILCETPSYEHPTLELDISDTSDTSTKPCRIYGRVLLSICDRFVDLSGNICTSPLHEIGMRPGDILVAFNSDLVDRDGNVHSTMSGSPLVSLEQVIQEYSRGSLVSFTFFSFEKEEYVTRETRLMCVLPDPIVYPCCTPSILTHRTTGGVCVMQRCRNHIEDLGDIRDDEPFHEHPALIVTFVVPHTIFSENDFVIPGDILTHINGTQTETISDYDSVVVPFTRRAISANEKSCDPTLKMKFKSGAQVVLNFKYISAIDTIGKSVYGLPEK